jgi:hypothetical protein
MKPPWRPLALGIGLVTTSCTDDRHRAAEEISPPPAERPSRGPPPPGEGRTDSLAPPAASRLEVQHSEELIQAAASIIGFLRGQVGFERILLADTVVLYLGPEGGGTRRAIPRARLREPANWSVRSEELGATYRFTPPAGLTKLTTSMGRHFRCFEYPLSSQFGEVARLPHVGTKLEPPDASSCLQSWNLTLVFAADEPSPILVAAVYDQWEW